eukprot:m.103826 g.103826  ORF g.103826 m.103826 type:complete len:349 (+) comp13827_c0_seq3:312-1358(+)
MEIQSVKGLVGTVYVVFYRNSSKILLLDSGCAGDVAAVRKHLQARGKDIRDISLAVTTHAHPDHFGGSHIYKQHGVPVAAPKNINHWYSGMWGSIQHRLDIALSRFVKSSLDVADRDFSKDHAQSPAISALKEICFPSSEFWFPRELNIDVNIETSAFKSLETIDGSKLELENDCKKEKVVLSPLFNDWEVFCIPGHTSHMICLFHEETQTLYASDLLVRRGLRTNLPIPIDFPNLCFHSLGRMMLLNVRHILLAHGGPHYNKEMGHGTRDKGTVDNEALSILGEHHLGSLDYGREVSRMQQSLFASKKKTSFFADLQVNFIKLLFIPGRLTKESRTTSLIDHKLQRI